MDILAYLIIITYTYKKLLMLMYIIDLLVEAVCQLYGINENINQIIVLWSVIRSAAWVLNSTTY